MHFVCLYIDFLAFNIFNICSFIFFVAFFDKESVEIDDINLHGENFGKFNEFRKCIP